MNRRIHLLDPFKQLAALSVSRQPRGRRGPPLRLAAAAASPPRAPAVRVAAAVCVALVGRQVAQTLDALLEKGGEFERN